MKVYDWLSAIAVGLMLSWGAYDIFVVTPRKADHQHRVEEQRKRIAKALSKYEMTDQEKRQVRQEYIYAVAKGREWEEQQRARDKKWVEDVVAEQKRREVVENNLKIYRETGYYPASGSVGFYGYTRQYAADSDSEDDEVSVKIARSSYAARSAYYDDDESGGDAWTSRRASYAKRYAAEQESQMDDYLGAINPREGLAIKTGGMAFRGNDVAINTGGGVTIEGSKAWIDTGSVIIKPNGGAIIRSGGMFFDDEGLRAQQIGGSGGDYLNRRGYSVNQSGMMLTDP